MRITKTMKSYISEINQTETRSQLIGVDADIKSDRSLSWDQLTYLLDEVTLKKADIIRAERA